jgi:type II secretory pathway pseudopilin PulG
LLVVIAIIGILSTLLLLQLNTARRKARDAKRVADVNQTRSALELYYDDNGQYLQQTDMQPLVTNSYLNKIPADPLTGTCTSTYDGAGGCYGYAYNTSNKSLFHLWAELEGYSSALIADLDGDSTGVNWAGATGDFSTAEAKPCPDADVTNQNCTYDVGQTQ